MKKTRFIALVLVAAMMLAGAGYAAWTDHLRVTTTVQTGELDVAFGTEEGFFNDVWAHPHIWIYDGCEQKWKDAKYERDLLSSDIDFAKMAYDLDEEEDWLKFTFTNMYPGTQARGRYNMSNVGTIPATIGNVSVTINPIEPGKDGDFDLPDAIVIRNSTFKIVRSDGTVESIKVDGIKLNQLEQKLKEFFVGKTLMPSDQALLGGDGIEDYFIFEIPVCSLNNSEGELETVEITIDFDFVQHNMYNPGCAE